MVATPIGNLSDMSARALSVLREVAVIACEDTRHTRRLCEAYAIKTPLVALHQHNERGSAQQLLQRLLAGQSVALVSDAGTPLISDPGATLTALAHQHGVKVSPIPGASSVLAALSVSGLMADSFVFAGFIPSKSAERQGFLQKYKAVTHTTVFFETPHRIAQTLTVMCELFAPSRELVIARELTKQFEQVVRLELAQALAWLAADAHHGRGEFVLVLAASEAQAQDDGLWQSMADEFLATGISAKDCANLVAKYGQAPKKTVYAYVLDRKKQMESVD